MVAVHDVLRRDTFGFRLDGDWHTVLVRAANHNHVFTFESEIAGVDVGRHIHTGEVSDVDRTVCVWQSCCNQRAFEFFFFHI